MALNLLRLTPIGCAFGCMGCFAVALAFEELQPALLTVSGLCLLVLVYGMFEEVRHLEASLSAARVRVARAQRLEVLVQLVSGLAHDMNNALTGVLIEASQLDGRVAKERERILESADHAVRLTRELMTLGRRDAVPPALDLGAWLRRAAGTLQRTLPLEIAFETRIAAEPIVVRADPVQLLQVLLNLAANARDAMAGRGTLVLALVREAQHSTITMQDTGTGIAPDVLPRVFDPFYTTKPAGLGTGLGLANVKRVVEALGGQVTVTSELGHGTTFAIRLPLADAGPAA